MKKYVVCKFWKYSAPDVVGQFDKKEDALAYARLSKVSSDNDFVVYELVK